MVTGRCSVKFKPHLKVMPFSSLAASVVLPALRAYGISCGGTLLLFALPFLLLAGASPWGERPGTLADCCDDVQEPVSLVRHPSCCPAPPSRLPSLPPPPSSNDPGPARLTISLWQQSKQTRWSTRARGVPQRFESRHISPVYIETPRPPHAKKKKSIPLLLLLRLCWAWSRRAKQV